MAKETRDERFGNLVLDAIVEKVEKDERFPTGLAGMVYERMGGESDEGGLRRLIVDLHVWIGRGQNLCSPHEDALAPKAFHGDVRREMKRAGMAIHDEEVEKPWEGAARKCWRYHVHETTERCGIEVVDLTMED